MPHGAAAPKSTAAAPLARWWLRFDDQLLVGLIGEALVANTPVRSAFATLAQSRAIFDMQAAVLLPRVTGQASAQRSKAGYGRGNQQAG